jgi:hypothetical protein
LIPVYVGLFIFGGFVAKRFTATDKWDDPWFFDLDNKYKLLWIYMLDKCDHAGILKVNKKMMGFCVGGKIDWKKVQEIFINRVHYINDEKWFIPKFVEFQYGVLKEESRPHQSVINTLKREGLFKIYKEFPKNIKGLAKGIYTLKDKVQDKEKDKVQDKDRKKKTDYSEFVSMTKDEYQKLVKDHGKEATKSMIEILNNYKAAKGKSYKSDYHAILNWVVKRYSEEKEPDPDPIFIPEERNPVFDVPLENRGPSKEEREKDEARRLLIISKQNKS